MSGRVRFLALVGAAALAAAPARGDDEPSAAPEEVGLCALDDMIDEARAGFASGSPAYRRYLAALLKEAALTLPLEALTRAVAEEHDPALLEALGAALAARASHAENPGLVRVLLERAAMDAEPSLRAAAVRALRATGSVETMAALGVTYADLVRDRSPEVRAAVADNLVAENRDVYGGRDARVAAAAAEVAGAAAARDPAIAGRVLAEISMEQAPPPALAAVTAALSAEAPELRAGAALALGSAPPSPGTRAALVERYRRELDPAVRRAVLHGLARQGQASAVPALRSLLGVAPALDAEIEVWIEVLGLGLQEWHLILREHLRRTGGLPR